MERLYQQIGEYALLLAVGDGDATPSLAAGVTYPSLAKENTSADQ